MKHEIERRGVFVLLTIGAVAAIGACGSDGAPAAAQPAASPDAGADGSGFDALLVVTRYGAGSTPALFDVLLR